MRAAAHDPGGAAGYLIEIAQLYVGRSYDLRDEAANALGCLAGFIASLMDARRAAELEARSARAISNYLVDMFDNTDPRKRGEDAKAKRTLDRSRRGKACDGPGA